MKDRKIKNAIERTSKVLGEIEVPEGFYRRMVLDDEIDFLTKEIRSNPNEPTFYLLRGQTHNKARNYPEAKQDLEKSRQLLDQGNTDKVYKYKPDFKKELFKELSLSEINAGDSKDAARYFIMSEIGEDVPEEFLESEEIGHVVKGYLFQLSDRREEQYNEYKRLLEVSPEVDSEIIQKFNDISQVDNKKRQEFIFTIFGHLERKFGNLENDEKYRNALKYYQKALELNPQSLLRENEIPYVESVLQN